MSKKEAKIILITLGAGFIGSHLVRRFVKNYSNYHTYNLVALAYVGKYKHYYLAQYGNK
jgi:dTDP-glucose 4,6-dehydratase